MFTRMKKIKKGPQLNTSEVKEVHTSEVNYAKKGSVQRSDPNINQHLKGRTLTGDLANGQVGAAKLKGPTLMGFFPSSKLFPGLSNQPKNPICSFWQSPSQIANSLPGKTASKTCFQQPFYPKLPLSQFCQKLSFTKIALLKKNKQKHYKTTSEAVKFTSLLLALRSSMKISYQSHRNYQQQQQQTSPIQNFVNADVINHNPFTSLILLAESNLSNQTSDNFINFNYNTI